jgi:hypothetical protein
LGNFEIKWRIDADRALIYLKDHMLELSMGKAYGEDGATAVLALVEAAQTFPTEQNFVNMCLAIEEYRRARQN